MLSSIASAAVPVAPLAGLAAELDQVTRHPERGQARDVLAVRLARRDAPARPAGLGRPAGQERSGRRDDRVVRRIASAVRTIRGSDAGQQAERDDQAEHADVQGRRALDQELGAIGPEAAEGREPSRVEEPARLGIDQPGPLGLDEAGLPRMPASQIRSASAPQRAAGSGRSSSSARRAAARRPATTRRSSRGRPRSGCPRSPPS